MRKSLETIVVSSADQGIDMHASNRRDYVTSI